MKNICTVILILALYPAAIAQTPDLNISLGGIRPYTPQTLSNVWHYTDEFGNEYALVGAQNGISIVDVTVPSSPFQVFLLE